MAEREPDPDERGGTPEERSPQDSAPRDPAPGDRARPGPAAGDPGTSRDPGTWQPLDEDAAWAELVRSFATEPADGAHPWPDIEDLEERPRKREKPTPPEDDAGPDGTGPDDAGPDGTGPDGTGPDDTEDSDDEKADDGRKRPGLVDGRSTDAARGIVVRVPPAGPRDWSAAEPADDADEGHFVPPEPPPLPHADTTTRFAWLGAVGGPLLLLGFVVLQQPLTWWATLLGIGGFLGGFGTLVARMRDRDDDEPEDPGGGAVV